MTTFWPCFTRRRRRPALSFDPARGASPSLISSRHRHRHRPRIYLPASTCGFSPSLFLVPPDSAISVIEEVGITWPFGYSPPVEPCTRATGGPGTHRRPPVGQGSCAHNSEHGRPQTATWRLLVSGRLTIFGIDHQRKRSTCSRVDNQEYHTIDRHHMVEIPGKKQRLHPASKNFV